MDTVGASRLLWGTDVPGLLSHATYAQLRDVVPPRVVARHCDFVLEAELAQVMGRNALEVYWGGDARICTSVAANSPRVYSRACSACSQVRGSSAPGLRGTH